MEKGKKRQRKARVKKEITLSIKERSKIHRDRKKKYYQDLEEKVKSLELENHLLKSRITELELTQKSSSASDPLSKLKNEEKFMYEVLPEIINKSPEKFRFSMYETCRETEGTFGSERIKVLKNNFNSIIEHCLPMNIKAILLGSNYIGFWKMIGIYRDINLHNRGGVYKYYRASLCEGDLSQPSPQTDTEKEEIRIRQKMIEIYYKYPYSKGIIECWKRIGMRNLDYLDQVQQSVYDLVRFRVRNKLFGYLEKFHNEFFDSGMYENFSMEDIASCHESAKEFKNSGLLDPFTLFKLKKRKSSDRRLEDDEISWFGFS